MEQALSNTNEQTDSVLSRAKQNFVPSSKQLVKDTIEMITNPVQTAKSLYELGSGIVQLAIPGEQGNEDTARAVGQHFADRYGSIEKAKETFATDPAAFALDALGVITGGAAIGVGVAKAGAKAVSKVGRKVDVDEGAARAAKATEPDRSGMGDLGDGTQPSAYAEALEVSDKYGNNSIFKQYLPGDADDYITYMDDTKELRNSSTIPNDYGLSATEFFETLSSYSDKNIIKYEAPESPGYLSELKSMSNNNPWYHLKENGDVILHVNRGRDRPVLGKPKKSKTLKISGGKKPTTKEQILEFLDINPKKVKNSMDESRGNSGEYKEIVFDMNKSKEQGIARAESLVDYSYKLPLKKGGTVMGLAAGGIATPGVAERDGFKDPTIVDPETGNKKVIKEDIKDKIKGVAKKPQRGNTNIQTAMLLEPEKLLKKYEKPITPPPNVLAANEGAMPVVEEDTQEQSTRQQRRSEIINQLDGAGLSVPAIKAIVGNIDIETGGTFSHTQKQEGGNGYGLFQLDFQKPFYDKYLESQNLEDSIGSQVNYFLDEINKGGTIGPGNAKSIMDVFNDPKTTPKEATIVLVDKFFKPGKPHLERRIASAMQGYDEELEGFKEGGLADNADDTPGATESEVADDIPAMISEGELVVPANVVRYHGLAKYENMRNAALKNLDALEDNGQIRPVDSDGTPIVKDVKEQTDEVMASKGATVARYNEGGSPTITTGGPRVPTTPARRESTIKYDEQKEVGENPWDYNYTPEGVKKYLEANPYERKGPPPNPDSKYTTIPLYYDEETNELVEGMTHSEDPSLGYISRSTPEEYFESRYRQYSLFESNPKAILEETKLKDPTLGSGFAPGANDTPAAWDDGGELAKYFTKDTVGTSIKGTLTTPEDKDYRVTNPNTKITATGPRTTGIAGGGGAGVDLENMPGFGTTRSGGSAPSGPDTVEKILSGVTTIAALDKLFLDGKITESVFKWGKENIFDPLGEFLGFDKTAAANVGIIKSVGSTIPAGSSVIGMEGKFFVSGGLGETAKTIEVSADLVDLNTMTLKSDFNTGSASTKTGADPTEIKPNISLEDAQAIQATTGTGDPLTYTQADGSTGIISGDGIFSWKGALATLGTALSIYDIIENGPTAANVTGALAGGAGMVTANVFGAGTALANANPAMYELIGKFAGPLMWAALAFAAYETFKGPPSGKVGEAAYNFDNPEYNSEDVMSGGFWTRKRSDDNITASLELTQSIGSYVHSMEEALGIDIGGELFVDVGNTNGLRYGWVDGYDQQELKRGYHKTDLDYKLLAGTGQVGKGYLGEDALSNFMEAIQDDTNVVVMFALADKASGGKGYATFDNVSLYRQKIQTLKTYKSGMAGSGTQAVLTEYERNILEGYQKKEFAEVTGDELAVLMPIYDKIAPVQQQNNYSFRGLGS